MAKDNRLPLLYQDLVESISFESLPSEWLGINLYSFSKNISLFDYQQEAIKNATELLHYYFESLRKFHEGEDESSNIERKKAMFNELIRFGREEKKLLESLGVTNKKNKSLFNKIKQYYPVIPENSHEKIPFLHFVNRMSFWMATGSGKTVILIKLVELLDKLMNNDCIPNSDILILTHRDDLIEQIKEHINEFNKNSTKKIRVWDLKRYDDVKRGSLLVNKDDINVFIYRSDLIAEETKEKLLGFEDIENNGKWYILLDEAHKGDKEDSKRQLFYSLLSRNGFLFNFSATFTHPWDIITTIYNFNLDTFIRKGYGKNVYLSQQELNAFKDKMDFHSKDKQKIVLKALVLLTITKIMKENIDKKAKRKRYHNPLLVSLLNSVNTEDSDLEIFFRQLEDIAKGSVDKGILNEAKEEIITELTEHPRYIFGSESVKIDEGLIKELDIKDILKYVFNSPSFGKVEVIKIPSNKQELIFKLKTSDKPFALTKIGDITRLLKKLGNYEINESYENQSMFNIISQEDNPINILMGSRAFYEGWDSNRPNVMVFINIGIGDAKKYVIQSIGRGVRIEPIKKKRKRLLPLKKENNLAAQELYSKLEPEEVSLIETLFVFGTNKRNVQEILESIKYERKTSGEIIELKENEQAKTRTLLIPVYKEKKGSVNVEELPKYEGDKELINNFINWINDERVFYALFSQEKLNPATIKKVNEFLQKGEFKKSDRYDVYSQTSRLIDHVNLTMQDIDKFKRLEDEIIHFKKIRVTLDNKELKKLKELIEKVKNFKDTEKEETKLKELLKTNKLNLEEYTTKIKELTKASNEEEFRDLRIKHLVNHYYVPLILSEKEKIDYINHIITVESERRFVEELESYIKQKRNSFEYFDWWMFSKLDEHLDEVYIPYYNREHNQIERFKPDFIFWMKKKNRYFILFADPKGTKHTDYEYKVDGYKSIFEENGSKKNFSKDGLNIQVHLLLFTEDENILSKGYKRYWFDRFDKLAEEMGLIKE